MKTALRSSRRGTVSQRLKRTIPSPPIVPTVLAESTWANLAAPEPVLPAVTVVAGKLIVVAVVIIATDNQNYYQLSGGGIVWTERIRLPKTSSSSRLWIWTGISDTDQTFTPMVTRTSGVANANTGVYKIISLGEAGDVVKIKSSATFALSSVTANLSPLVDDTHQSLVFGTTDESSNPLTLTNVTAVGATLTRNGPSDGYEVILKAGLTASGVASSTVSHTLTNEDLSIAMLELSHATEEPPTPSDLFYEIIADDPEGFWVLDETLDKTSGAQFLDLGGDFRHAAPVGGLVLGTRSVHTGTPSPDFTAGGYITVPDNAVWSSYVTPATGKWTMEMLLIPDSMNAAMMLATKGNPVSGSAEFQFRIEANGSLLIDFMNASGSASQGSAQSEAGVAVVGQKMLVAARVDRATNTINILKNGIIVATGAFSGVVQDLPGALLFGERADGAGTPFDGTMGYVSIYDTALSDQRLLDHATAEGL